MTGEAVHHDASAEAVTRHRLALAALLVGLALYRAAVGWSGQLYWPDEYRYLHALHVLDELRKGELVGGLTWVFGEFATERGVASQPSYILFSMVPAFIQGVANLLLGIEPSSPVFYRIPAAVNVITSLGLTLVLYRLGSLLTGDSALALLSVFVHGLLANTNLYVRHLFPYDLALLLFLTSLVVLLDPMASQWGFCSGAAKAGILCGIGITTYQGYNPFVVIILAVVVEKYWGAWRQILAFLVALFSVGLIWEGCAQFGGFSFVSSVQRFSQMYTSAGIQGSTEESYFFLPLYLWEVEGVLGVTLLALFVCFLGMVVARKLGKPEVTLIGAASITYLSFATFSVVSHRIALYGRLLHMYLPFFVLGVVMAIKHFSVPHARKGAALALVLASLTSFLPTAMDAFAISFPKDVERDIKGAFAGNLKLCEMGTYKIDEGSGSQADCDLIIENVRHLYPLPSVLESLPPPGFKLAKEYKHPLQFIPYWFEGYKPDERARLSEHPPVMRVYVRSELPLTFPPLLHQGQRS